MTELVKKLEDFVARTRESRLLKCSCGHDGHVRKRFRLQDGKDWKPYLKGAIALRPKSEEFQPVVLLLSEKTGKGVTHLWFRYCKDLRSNGGRFKWGDGPGGGPVLKKEEVVRLLAHLKDLEVLE